MQKNKLLITQKVINNMGDYTIDLNGQLYLKDKPIRMHDSSYNLWIDGVLYKVGAGRLILTKFGSPQPCKTHKYILHIDNDQNNFSISNIEWSTRQNIEIHKTLTSYDYKYKYGNENFRSFPELLDTLPFSKDQLRYMIKIGKITKLEESIIAPIYEYKTVVIDKKTNKTYTFPSPSEAVRLIGIDMKPNSFHSVPDAIRSKTKKWIKSTCGRYIYKTFYDRKNISE